MKDTRKNQSLSPQVFPQKSPGQPSLATAITFLFSRPIPQTGRHRTRTAPIFLSSRTFNLPPRSPSSIPNQPTLDRSVQPPINSRYLRH
ncbi:hypothetical protein Peur_041063 [Populus x canadensis]